MNLTYKSLVYKENNNYETFELFNAVGLHGDDSSSANGNLRVLKIRR